MADALDLGSSGAILEGSSPSPSTLLRSSLSMKDCFRILAFARIKFELKRLRGVKSFFQNNFFLLQISLVRSSWKNPDIKKDVDDIEKVFIPQRIFQAILPILQSPYSQEDIPAVISRYFYTIERSNKAREITSQCFHCKDDIGSLEVDTLVRNDINNLSARIIREEVRVILVIAMLCQFPYA